MTISTVHTSKLDGNATATLMAVSSTDDDVLVALRADPTTGALIMTARTIDVDVQTAALPTQTAFTTVWAYTVGAKSLLVFLGGMLMAAGTDYTETDALTVTFATPVTGGDIVTFVRL